jgi:hypothetical protein
LNSPDGQYCANPDDTPEEQTWISSIEALGYAVNALENFAETGSFANGIDFKVFAICERYRSLTNNGANRETAIDQLVVEFHRSRSTIERIIRIYKANAKAHAERSVNAKEIGRAFALEWAKPKKTK